MSSLEDDLEQARREKEWAETWTPDSPGDALIGTLEAIDTAETEFGACEVAHIRTEEGILKGLWLMHTVLQNEWEEAAPEKGDRVGAIYHGQRSGSDYDYHMWSVKVDHKATDEPAGAKDDRPDSEVDPNKMDGKDKAEALYGADEQEPEFEPDDTLPF